MGVCVCVGGGGGGERMRGWVGGWVGGKERVGDERVG